MSENVSKGDKAHENVQAIDETGMHIPAKLPDANPKQAGKDDEVAHLREKIDSRTEYLNSIKLKIS